MGNRNGRRSDEKKKRVLLVLVRTRIADYCRRFDGFDEVTSANDFNLSQSSNSFENHIVVWIAVKFSRTTEAASLIGLKTLFPIGTRNRFLPILFDSPS